MVETIPTMKFEDDLFPLGVAAAHLGLDRRDLRLAVERGDLPHVRIGDRGVMVSLAAVRAVLAERAVLPARPAREEAGR